MPDRAGYTKTVTAFPQVTALCSPAKGYVARGGVEPPTFRFSVGRSYQLSYLAWCFGTWYPEGGVSADRVPRPDTQNAAHWCTRRRRWRS